MIPKFQETNLITAVRFQTCTVASERVTDVWDIVSCCLEEVDPALMMEAVRTFETPVNFYDITRR
jgi:hypothetical protein